MTKSSSGEEKKSGVQEKNKDQIAQSSEMNTTGMMFQGWLSVALWMMFGLLLEGLLGYKIPVYLEDTERRELFRLAHAHGTLLGLVLVVAALWVEKKAAARGALIALRIGSIVMPLGFALAGVWHPEGDPGPFIWLVPPGALLVIFGTLALALSARKKTEL
jgi:hypothetical protein